MVVLKSFPDRSDLLFAAHEEPMRRRHLFYEFHAAAVDVESIFFGKMLDAFEQFADALFQRRGRRIQPLIRAEMILQSFGEHLVIHFERENELAGLSRFGNLFEDFLRCDRVMTDYDDKDFAAMQTVHDVIRPETGSDIAPVDPILDAVLFQLAADRVGDRLILRTVTDKDDPFHLFSSCLHFTDWERFRKDTKKRTAPEGRPD